MNIRDESIKLVRACTSVAEIAELLGHWDGYVREAAVKRAAVIGGAGAMAAILPRLNDWVPQVRDAARSAVLALLPLASSDEQLGCMACIWRLRRFSRWNHEEWIARARVELARVLDLGLLLSTLNSTDPLLARGSFQLLLEGQLVPLSELLEIALASRVDVVMAVQAAHLALGAPGDERDRLLRRALGSRFGTVRAVALRGLLEHAPDAVALARNALLDVQGAVRSFAQYYLRQNGQEPAAFYCDLLRNAGAGRREVCIAIAACSDLALVRARIASHFPSVRSTAYTAWLRLAPNEKDDIARHALSDDSRANRALACRMITRLGAYVPFEVAMEILRDRKDLPAVLALARQRKWDWLETLVREAWRVDEGGIEWKLLEHSMRDWLNHARRAYERPNDAQKARLAKPTMVGTMERLLERSETSMPMLHYELEKYCNWTKT